MIFGIYYDVWNGEFDTSQLPRTRFPVWVWKLFQKAIWEKSNPRSEEYMRKLFLEKVPDGTFRVFDGTKEKLAKLKEEIGQAKTVFLLYPDAIGLGFRKIESLAPAAHVLNGRRRDFALTASVRRSLRFRRFLEWSMLPEILFIPVFLAITPFFLLHDFLRGKF